MSDEPGYTYTIDTVVGILQSGDLSPRSELYRFLRDEKNVWAVLDLIANGLELPFVSANAIRQSIGRLDANAPYGEQADANKLRAREFWQSAAPDNFTDDSKFTNARFQLILYTYDEQTDKALLLAAFEQLKRMLHAGRANMIQINRLPYIAVDHELWEIVYWVGAHDDSQFSNISGDSPKSPYVERRKQIFTEHWLRALLSETEYAQIRTLSAQILKELYPNIWQQGYGLYQDHQRSNVVI